MKNKKILLLAALMSLGLCSSAQAAQQKSTPPLLNQRPPVHRLNCIDIEVNSFTAALVSTQAGNPAVEFPHDTVRLRLVLKNVGGLALPPASIDVSLQRNHAQIQTRTVRNMLQAKGGSWETTFTDSFPHGVKTTYSVFVSLHVFGECTTDNNQASFTIDEAKLHSLMNTASRPALTNTDIAPLTAPKIMAPSALQAKRKDNKLILLGWQDNSADESGFMIERKTGNDGPFEPFDRVGKDVTHFADRKATPGVPCTYRVRAFQKYQNRHVFSAFSNEAAASIPQPPIPTVFPFVVNPEKLTITGKNPAPVIPLPFAPLLITTESLTITGGNLPQAAPLPFTPVVITTEALTISGKAAK